MYIKKDCSPCEGCMRVANPDACENKNCKLWKNWFLRRWAGIYAYGRRHGLQAKRCCHEMET